MIRIVCCGLLLAVSWTSAAQTSSLEEARDAVREAARDAVEAARDRYRSRVAELTGEAASDTVQVNQVGYHPAADKVAWVAPPVARRAALVDEAGKIVMEANLPEPTYWEPADQRMQRFDFSAVRAEGRYTVVVDGKRRSPRFTIDDEVLETVGAAALKAFYFNRASTPISREHGGAWSRAAGHSDTRVLVHESAASRERPAGTIISSPGGWYDAADYNKYVVNASFATYALLAAYEDAEATFRTRSSNIPESNNAVPDLLDEARFNLDWLLTMQDPNDGGVYHKLTSKTFSGFIMPASDAAPRYVVQKSTAAALDFAAVSAFAARVFRELDPRYSRRLRNAATAAWRWSLANPSVLYEQPEDIVTGTYANARERLVDERLWAATELTLTTGDRAYLDGIALDRGAGSGIPGWSQVAPLAWLSLLRFPDAPTELRAVARRQVLRTADRLVEVADGAGGVGVSLAVGDFVWGSNSVAAIHAVMLNYAAVETDEPRYLRVASADIDYLLGRNPLGLSFLTGFGTRTPRNIHHRPSIADGVALPVPGFLVGGPNSRQNDIEACAGKYRSDLPALSYVDDVCSYASNEIAINWNAAFVWAATLTQRELDGLPARQ